MIEVTSNTPMNRSANTGSLSAVASFMAPITDFSSDSNLASSVALTSLSPITKWITRCEMLNILNSASHITKLSTTCYLLLQQLAISFRMHRSMEASMLNASSQRAVVSIPAATISFTLFWIWDLIIRMVQIWTSKITSNQGNRHNL